MRCSGIAVQKVYKRTTIGFKPELQTGFIFNPKPGLKAEFTTKPTFIFEARLGQKAKFTN